MCRVSRAKGTENGPDEERVTCCKRGRSFVGRNIGDGFFFAISLPSRAGPRLCGPIATLTLKAGGRPVIADPDFSATNASGNMHEGVSCSARLELIGLAERESENCPPHGVPYLRRVGVYDPNPELCGAILGQL